MAFLESKTMTDLILLLMTDLPSMLTFNELKLGLKAFACNGISWVKNNDWFDFASIDKSGFDAYL